MRHYNVESMFKLLRENQDVQDVPFAPKLKLPSAAHARVEFENVQFSYDIKTDRKILKGVSFEVQPGEKVAIVVGRFMLASA